MAAYTFICLGHDGAVAAIDAADCADDAEAQAAALHLFRDAPHMRTGQVRGRIEVYEGGRLLHADQI